MAKVEIKTFGPTGNVFIDGKEVPDVCSYSISHSAGNFPIFNIGIITDELKLSGDRIPTEQINIYCTKKESE